MKLYVRLEAPYEWVRTSGKGVEAFGEVPSPAEFPLSEEDQLIGVVPGEWVTAHKLSLPTRSKKQFQAAVPYALEDQVSDEVEDLHFSCTRWQAGEENVVHVVAREKMKSWQTLANENRLPLDSLVPEYSLLPMHSSADCTLALKEGSEGEKQLLALDKQGFGSCVDESLVEVWLKEVPMASVIAITDEPLVTELIARHSDRDFRYWQAGSKIAHWLEHEPISNTNLLDEQYRPSVRQFNFLHYKLPLILLFSAVLLMISYQAYRYLSLHAEIQRIDSEMVEIVTRTLPELSSVEAGKERYMMEQILVRRGGPKQVVGVPEMLAEAAIILKRYRVSLNEIVFRDEQMIITCILNDLSQVDAIRKHLNSRPSINAQLESSAADDGQIVASYVLTANQ